jgi:hypothetical protein
MTEIDIAFVLIEAGVPRKDARRFAAVTVNMVCNEFVLHRVRHDDRRYKLVLKKGG